ncbi:MAG: T9SS type A sorting domain-containing protein [Spirosomataceae bacterium]
MRKLTHVFRWCLAAILLMIGTVVHAQITSVTTSATPSTCAGSTHTVTLSGTFVPGCLVSFYLVNNTGTQVGPALLSNQNAGSQTYTVTIPSSIAQSLLPAPGGYAIRAISTCGGGEVPVGAGNPGPFPAAGANSSAAFSLYAAYTATGTIGWDNSLTTAAGFSTTGPAVACLGTSTSGSLTLRAQTLTNATAGDFYYWYKDGGNIPVASGVIATAAGPDAAYTIVDPTYSAAGVYTLVLTSSTGAPCNRTIGSITVQVSAGPSLIGANYSGFVTTICAGATANISVSGGAGGTPPYTYTWTRTPGGVVPGASGATLQLVPAGVAGPLTNLNTDVPGTYAYFPTVTDANGCAATAAQGAQLTITSGPGQVSITGPVTTVCTGGTINLSANTSLFGNVFPSGVTFAWAGPNGFASTQEDPSFAATTTLQNGVYTVTAVAGACSATATFNLTKIRTTPAPVITSGDMIVCAGKAFSLSGTAGMPAGEPADLSWYIVGEPAPGPGLPYDPFTPIGAVLPTYFFAGGSVPVGTTIAFNDGTLNLNTLAVNVTGTKSTTLSFTNGLPSLAQLGAAGFPVIPASSNNWALVLRADNDICNARSPFKPVVIVETPTAAIATNSAICQGATLSLTATSGAFVTVAQSGFAWAGPNGFTATTDMPSISNAGTAASGIYTVTVKNNVFSAQSCVSTATASVQVVQVPTAVVTGPTKVCQGSTVALSGSGGLGAANEYYTWEEFSGGAWIPAGVPPRNKATYSPTTASLGSTDYRVVVDNLLLATGPVPPPAICRSISQPITVTVYSVPTITSYASAATPPAVYNNAGLFTQCSGTQLNLSVAGTTTGAGVKYSWSASNGFSSTEQNPSVTSNAQPANSGKYTASVFNTAYDGCYATTSMTLNILQTPTAVINGPAVVNVCQYSPLTLTGTGGVAGEKYAWEEFSGGAWVAAGVIPNNTGSYTPTTQSVGATKYRLVVDNATNPPLCRSISAEVVVNVAAQPVLTAAGATAAVTVPGIGGASGRFMCSGLPLSVNVGVVTPPAANTWNYAWTGPLGYTSTQKNPTVQTAAQTGNSGVYAVVVSNPASPVCSVSSKVEVTVVQTPTITDIIAPQTVCAGSPVVLTGAAINANSYQWTTGAVNFPAVLNGLTVTFTSDANQVASSPATYSLIATNNFSAPNGATVISCPSAPMTTKVTVSPNPNILGVSVDGPLSTVLPGAANGYDANTYFLCSGTLLKFTTLVNGAADTFKWAGPSGFSSTQLSPTVSTSANVTMSGIYSITAYGTNTNCQKTATISVQVVNRPTAVTAGNAGPYCAGQTISLTASATDATSFSWYFPGSAPYPAAADLTGASASRSTSSSSPGTAESGTYTVVATNTLVAPNGVTIIVCPISPAAASATTSVTVHALPAFTGNGGYVAQGAAPITRNGAVAAGSTTYLTDNVSTGFTGWNFYECAGPAVTLNGSAALAVGASGGINYSWSGPNGFSSTNNQPLVTASGSSAVSGAYVVTIVNSLLSSCSATSSLNLNIVNRPTSISATNSGPYCAGQTISLTASAVDANSFSWYFPGSALYPAAADCTGSTTTRSTSSTSAGTAESGTYYVYVTNTITSPITGSTILTCPVAGAEADARASTSVTVHANPAFSSNSGYTAQGGAPGTRTGAVVQGATTYLSDNASTGLTGWNFYQCAGPAVTLQGAATLPVGASGSINYAWGGPNGFSSTLTQPLVVASGSSAQSGVYTITLANSLLSSCSATSTLNLTVVNRPTSLTASNTGPYCEGATVSLSASAVDGNSFSWYFPGSTVGAPADRTGTSTTRSSITTAQAGTYTVLVTNTVTSPITGSTILTCPAVSEPTATATTTVTVRANPTFNSNPFNAVGINALAGGIAAGTRNGIVVSNGVLADVATTGFSSPAWNFYICEGSPLALNGGATISADGFTYSWSGPNGFGSNLSQPIVNVNATPNMSGVYVLTIANTSSPFCSATSSLSVSVLGKPTATNVAPDQSVCVGSAVTLSAALTNATGSEWTTGTFGYPSPVNAVTTFTTDPNMLGGLGPHSYTQGIATYTLALRNQYNSPVNAQPIARCNVNSAASITVKVNPSPLQTRNNVNNYGGPYTVCEGVAWNVSPQTGANAATGPLSYVWSGPGGFTSTSASLSFSAPVPANSGVYTVVITNQFGCTDTGTVQLTVYPKQVVSVSVSPSVLCQGGTYTLSASAVLAGSSYAWSGPSWLPSSALANPTITVTNAPTSGDGVYSFTVTASKNGCEATASTTVMVQAVPKIKPIVIDDATVCTDGKVKLAAEATNATKGFVSSWVWSGPGGFTASGPNVTLTQANLPGVYTVFANTSAGCQSSATVEVVPNLITGVTESDMQVVVNGVAISNGGTAYVPAGTAISLALQALNGKSISGFANTLCNGNPGPNIDFFGPLGYQAFPNLFVGPKYSVVPENGCGFYNGSLTPIAGTSTYGAYKVVFAKYCGGTITYEFTIAPAITATLSASASPSATTAGNTVGLAASVSGGAATGFAWAGPGGFSSNQQNPSFTAGTGNSGVFTVSATVNGAGVLTATVAVSVSAAPAPGVANLSLLKDSKYLTMVPGTKTYITITVRNSGPNTATGVFVGDVLPAGMTYTTPSQLGASDDGIEHNGNGANYGSFSVSGSTITANMGSIAPGATKEVKFYVTVTGTVGSTIKNKGEITASNNPDPNSTPGNGNTSEDDYDEVVITLVSTSTSRVVNGEAADVSGITVKTYPNPSSDKVTIELTLDEPAKAQLRMTDFSGRTVGEWKLDEETTHHTAEISVKEFKAGLYLLNAEAGTKRAVKKIVRTEN